MIWNGNNKADALAKPAVDEYIQFNGLKYDNHTYFNQYNENTHQNPMENNQTNKSFTYQCCHIQKYGTMGNI